MRASACFALNEAQPTGTFTFRCLSSRQFVTGATIVVEIKRSGLRFLRRGLELNAYCATCLAREAGPASIGRYQRNRLGRLRR
jgi:hypothetical protein